VAPLLNQVKLDLFCLRSAKVCAVFCATRFLLLLNQVSLSNRRVVQRSSSSGAFAFGTLGTVADRLAFLIGLAVHQCLGRDGRLPAINCLVAADTNKPTQTRNMGNLDGSGTARLASA
jgi:hypothetical protein